MFRLILKKCFGAKIYTFCSFFPDPLPSLRLYMVVINTPILVTALLYVKLFLVARKHVAAIAAQPGERTAGHSDHAWRYAKTVLLIVGVYFACWVPMGRSVVSRLRQR